MYSTHNEGKSVVAEKFSITLKSRVYKCMTLLSKTVYIDKLDGIVNEYNNAYQGTIKTKPVHIKDNTYFDYSEGVTDKDRQFKIADHVRISKYKNSFVKGYTPNRSKEVFVIKKKIKRQYHGHMLLMILMLKKLFEHFIKKNCKNQNKNNLG